MSPSAPSPSPPSPPTKNRRLRAALLLLLVVGFLELLARQYVARPNRILRPSTDPDMVFENSPGNWLGHATYDVWRAPLYMVLDFLNTGGDPGPGPPPAGYTHYRIDADGCRVHPGAGEAEAEVLVVGSSQSFGMLMPAEDTLPALLQGSLRERGFAGVRVANCGVVGHHFIQTLRTAERVLPTKRPKLVVALVRPWHMTEQTDYTKVFLPENRVVRRLTEWSSLARLAYYLHRRQPADYEQPLPDALVEAKLDRYVQDVGAAGARSIFFLLDDKAPDVVVFDALAPRLAARGIAVERIWTPGGKQSHSREYFVDHDQHWNRKGAEVSNAEMIDAVARELAAAGMARAATPPPAR